MESRTFRLIEIAEWIEGELVGDREKMIAGVQAVEKASENEIAFIGPGRTMDSKALKAGALILSRESKLEYPHKILVDDPYFAISKVLEVFYPRDPFSSGIDPTAVIHESAFLGQGVSVGPYSVIGPDVRIGRDSEIHSGVVIYKGVHVGEQCLIFSGTVFCENVFLGDRVVVHPGVVVGADGFGFRRGPDGIPRKIPQKGRVIIGNDCEIGANACIDRSTIDETVLEDHVKLDNMVQIGHNVHVGAGTMISAQTGVSGSTRIGREVVIGGQVGIADHIEIADGVMIAGRSGITGSIRKKMIVSGYPHQEIAQWRRNQAVFRHLDDLRNQIRELQDKIKKMEEK